MIHHYHCSAGAVYEYKYKYEYIYMSPSGHQVISFSFWTMSTKNLYYWYRRSSLIGLFKRWYEIYVLTYSWRTTWVLKGVHCSLSWYGMAHGPTGKLVYTIRMGRLSGKLLWEDSVGSSEAGMGGSVESEGFDLAKFLIRPPRLQPSIMWKGIILAGELW